MRLPLLVAAFAVFSATFASISARADSIVYDASESSAGVYVYDLNTASADLPFVKGDTVTFTGLVGVTGASTPFTGIFTTSYTTDSVTFTATRQDTILEDPNPFDDIFTIDSTAALGAITYTSDVVVSPALSGSVEGPATLPAATPEPSSIALLSSGLLGIAGVLRKRLA